MPFELKLSSYPPSFFSILFYTQNFMGLSKLHFSLMERDRTMQGGTETATNPEIDITLLIKYCT